jgi:3-methylcrotonyl-CoA carboxylase alpha subunit
MGSKSAAKSIMEKAAIPLLPGYHGTGQDAELLKREAEKIGYPVLLKAVAGGGGKGMRQVLGDADFDEELVSAKREALSGFGDDTMLVEKLLLKPRHIEVQVFCDTAGNGVYLFERDCSIQRRHQKIIEEAPAPGMTPELRAQMGEAAVRAALAINYVGAGTVEFLLSEDADFYFMEMNTRLQVEHPVTEMITGLDLVEWQLKIAAGDALPLAQSELSINGHAIEARIYAEDPDNDFLPAAGHLSHLRSPVETKHVRVDNGVKSGNDVGVFYDPMIAKLIAWDENRTDAALRLSNALSEYRTSGIKTNIEFLKRVTKSEPFLAAELDTGFIVSHQKLLFEEDADKLNNWLPVATLFMILYIELDSQRYINAMDLNSPWNRHDQFRLNVEANHRHRIQYGDDELSLAARETTNAQTRAFFVETYKGTVQVVAESIAADSDAAGSFRAAINDVQRTVDYTIHHQHITLYMGDDSFEFDRLQPETGVDSGNDMHAGFSAPMNGTVIEVLVSPGDKVTSDQTLVIMEAMKMEHAIKAPSDGTVSEIFYDSGDLVAGGDELLIFQPELST